MPTTALATPAISATPTDNSSGTAVDSYVVPPGDVQYQRKPRNSGYGGSLIPFGISVFSLDRR